MTRQSLARWLAFATAALVVLLSAVFALLRNLAVVAYQPPVPAPTPPRELAAPAAPAAAPAIDPARIAAGQRAYARLGCAMCHSIAGSGNPASPLDGVGARLDRTALVEWTTGTGAASEALGPGLVRRKARYAGDADLEVLTDYLAQLR